MGGGAGGGDAAILFDELAKARSELAQQVRRRLSPPDTPVTWLGTPADLADMVAGSVLLCKESGEEFAMVIPPRAPSAPPVKRIRGVVSVRVSRSGAATAAKYMKLPSFHNIVDRIVPGVLTMENTRGRMAGTLRLSASGESASLIATESAEGTPWFTVANGQGDVIGESSALDDLMGRLSVEATDWSTFVLGGDWGLPPVHVDGPATAVTWTPTDDALSMATEFGLPAVSCNLDILQFLAGCCEEAPSLETEAAELSAVFDDNAPDSERNKLEELFRRLQSATRASTPVVDSVHSRLRAIRASEDAPAPFCAFGMAWRQGALEPSVAGRRSYSRPPSPAPTGAASSGRAQSPRARQERSSMAASDELDSLTPNTLRQRLREAIACMQPTAAGAALQPTPPLHLQTPQSGVGQGAPTAAGTYRPTQFRHTGQLGGLFGHQAQGQPLRPLMEAAAPPRVAQPGPSPPVVAPSIYSAMQTITPEGGPAIATAVIIPQAAYQMPVTAVVQELASHGLPEAVAQFAHAAGDSVPTTAGSVFEATSLLRHIEEVFVDVSEELPTFNFLDTPAASNWHEAVVATQLLLARFSSAFRAKRNRTQPGVATSALVATRADDKPPVGSYKQVATATATERAGACDAQLLEEMASSTVLRREHVRQSMFCEPSTTISDRDAALAGELAHFCTTYGQAATAYILSNGTAQTALSGYGVPMALAAIRLHLLARATKLVHSTVGFERALAMHTKCTGLALSFLTGLVVVEDCVTILGGSPPHEDAELRREGGATAAGTLGTTSGPNAQLSIREAFALWGGGLHEVIGNLPGLKPSSVDFAVGAQLKKIPRELEDAKLLSICRYMTSRLGVVLSAHRTVRGSPLPDVAEIVAKAMNEVFRERDQDQRAEERAAAVAAPLLARIEKLETMGATRKPWPATSAQPAVGYNRAASSSTPRKRGEASTYRESGRGYAKRSSLTAEDTAPTTEPSAQERTDNFLASLHAAPPAPRQPQPTAHASKMLSWAAGDDGPIHTRRQALLELAALYRKHAGLDPKGDPSIEPCAYKALVGSCTQDGCRRCASGIAYPAHLLKGVSDRCAPAVFDRAPKNKKANHKEGGPSGSK